MQTRAPLAGCRGGILVKILAAFVVFLAIATLGWMLFLPAVVTRVLRSRTQFGVTVQSLAVNPFTATVRLRGLAVDNPADFPAPDFVRVREFRATAGFFSLFGDRPVIDATMVDVAQVTLVKNKEGQRNAALFLARLTGSSDQTRAVAPPAIGPAPKPRAFLIRHLELRFDRLRLVDASGDRPSRQEFDLGLRQTYENVTSPVQIAVPIVGKVTALGGTLGDLAGKLGADTFATAKRTGEVLKEVGQKAGHAIKELFQSLEQTPKK